MSAPANCSSLIPESCACTSAAYCILVCSTIISVNSPTMSSSGIAPKYSFTSSAAIPICWLITVAMVVCISSLVSGAKVCSTIASSSAFAGIHIISTYALAFPLSSNSSINFLNSATFSESDKSPEFSLNGKPLKISFVGLSSCALIDSDSFAFSTTYLVNSLVYPMFPVNMDATASSFGRIIPEILRLVPLSYKYLSPAWLSRKSTYIPRASSYV